MSLVWAALTPHPPILLESIGKENTEKLEKTKKAFDKLAESLYLSKPDLIIVLTAHGLSIENTFVMNMGKEKDGILSYEANFEEFGDFNTKFSWETDLFMSFKIKSFLETKIPLQLLNQDDLDHGSSIPLHFLSQSLKDIKILSITTSNFDTETHQNFGRYLKEIISNEEKRVAIIASGDLSHLFEKDEKIAEKFDEAIRKSLNPQKMDRIINMDPDILENAGECAYKQLVTLLAIIEDYNWKFEELSYEHPFGIGYLTGEFKLF